MEIKPLLFLRNAKCPFVSIVSKDNLLKVEECSFVINSLSDLYLTIPGMGSVTSFTIITLLVCNNELNYECLLEHCVLLDFFLDCELNFDSSRMGLCPDKGCVQ